MNNVHQREQWTFGSYLLNTIYKLPNSLDHNIISDFVAPILNFIPIKFKCDVELNHCKPLLVMPVYTKLDLERHQTNSTKRGMLWLGRVQEGS